jgi:YVTN family beta-propeller protein
MAKMLKLNASCRRAPSGGLGPPRRAFGPAALLLLAASVLHGCLPQLATERPELGSNGELCVYWQPLPETERIELGLGAVAALHESDPPIGLAMALSRIEHADAGRQRLLACGLLPPGRYTGLTLALTGATLRQGREELPLEIPETPVRAEGAFRVQSGKSHLMWLELRSAGLQDGGSLTPVLSLIEPDRSPLGLTGYVTNTGGNSITVFDKRAGQAVAMIATRSAPRGLALDARSARAFVVLSGRESGIDVIDLAAGERIASIRLAAGDEPREAALTPDGRTLLVTNQGSNSVSSIDPAGFVERARIRVGDGPGPLWIDPDGKLAYVCNTLSATLSVIDIPSQAVVTTVGTEQGPVRAQLDPRRGRIYVAHELAPVLLVMARPLLDVVNRVYIGGGVKSLAVDSRTGRIYLSRIGDSMVQVLDPLSLTPAPAFDAGGEVDHLTIDDQENTLHLLMKARRRLKIVNLTSRKLLSEIDLGEAPGWVTMMGER